MSTIHFPREILDSVTLLLFLSAIKILVTVDESFRVKSLMDRLKVFGDCVSQRTRARSARMTNATKIFLFFFIGKTIGQDA